MEFISEILRDITNAFLVHYIIKFLDKHFK